MFALHPQVLLTLLPVAAGGAAAAVTARRSPPPAARRLPGEPERWGAVHAMKLAGGSPTAAASFFIQMGYEMPAKWKAFAGRWSARRAEGEPLTARQPGGRPPLLPDSLIRTIATEWMMKGVGSGTNHRPYLSVEEVSCAQLHRSCPASAGAAARLTSLVPSQRQPCSLLCRHVRSILSSRRCCSSTRASPPST